MITEPINGRSNLRLKAEDIRHPARMTEDQIANLPIEKVYEWIKTGAWRKRDFERWLKVLRVIE